RLPTTPLSPSNASPPTPISPLSLHDALPICFIPRGHHRARICDRLGRQAAHAGADGTNARPGPPRNGIWCSRHRDIAYLSPGVLDRKSTRLNSSHVSISYAVFCLKKKI